MRERYYVLRGLTREQYIEYSSPDFCYFCQLWKGLVYEPFMVQAVVYIMFILLLPLILVTYATLKWKVWRFRKKYPEELI